MSDIKRRLLMVAALLACAGLAAALMVNAFRDNVMFFLTPSEVLAAEAPRPDRDFRLGGIVVAGSVMRDPADQAVIRFDVADESHSVTVRYRGILPDLFREGQTVVADGRFGEDRTFKARQVLAKHDETYMPVELMDTLQSLDVPAENFHKPPHL